MKAKQIRNIWFFIISALLILRITVLSDSNEDLRFVIFQIYSLSLWLALMMIGFIRNKQFKLHLRINHPEIYSQFYSRAYGMDVIVDPIALIKFGYSKKKYDDEKLNSFVEEMRNFTNLILLAFISLPILFLLMII